MQGKSRDIPGMKGPFRPDDLYGTANSPFENRRRNVRVSYEYSWAFKGLTEFCMREPISFVVRDYKNISVLLSIFCDGGNSLSRVHFYVFFLVDYCGRWCRIFFQIVRSFV